MKGIYIGSWAILAVQLCAYAQVMDSQYLVYLNSDDPFVIQQAKTIAPDAFTGSLDSGRRVLQLGRYTNLNLAQKRSDELRALGLPVEIARVTGRLPSSALPGPNGFNPAPTTVVSTVPGQPASNPEPVLLPNVPSTVEPTPPPGAIEITRPAPNGNNIVTPPPSPLPTTTSTVGQELQAFAQRNRYFVIIPTVSEDILARVKQIVPTAKLSASERGAYIEIKGYPDRGSAEELNRDMRNRGFDSRVIFF
ncbi:MAG: hypothetical protein RMK91_04305 [Pseudanabaenaceae cyanobacterium SKYGB_i_bin29]|nr:hypothetical protein [Pseudanabaenaceae cyanobacterium SKYG29]MDW8421067.1 hypothetical protein [Pseudanabaenaceae cyanobacterium SKYGB_i_bin29]